MTATTEAVSTIGARVYKATAAAPAVFSEIKECISLPELGAPRSEIVTTFTSATAATRIAGRKDGKEVEFIFNRIPGDPIQEAIIDNFTGDCDNEQWRVTADADNSRIYGFEMVYLDVAPGQELEAQQKLIVRGRISGELDWDASL